MEKLASGEAVAAARTSAPAGGGAGEGPMLKAPADFGGLIDFLAANGKPHLAQQLHDYCGLVRYAPPELVVRPSKPLSGDFIRDAAASLKALTGTQWLVRSSDEQAEPTLLEQEKGEAERLRQSVLDSPLVRAAFEAFPGAELASYTIEGQRSA
jgi:DNA polymerase-3 subunit gamma/tau